jgi:hypothetical protein
MEHEKFVRDRYDSVLCQGSFYHLLHREEGEKLLRDCTAMRRPGRLRPSYLCHKAGASARLCAARSRMIVSPAWVLRSVSAQWDLRQSFQIAPTTMSLLKTSVPSIKEPSKQFKRIQRDGDPEAFGLAKVQVSSKAALSQHLGTLPPEAFCEWVKKMCSAQADKPGILGAANYLLGVSENLRV